MLKLPYGLSNFKEIRTEDYLYVDKTRYIELLEALPEKYPVILRSRRFGKTLFANMLGYYYDQRHAGEFERIFKGTYIYEHPTPRHHGYLMLTFNFSGVNTETLENANEGFTSEVRRQVESFLTRYTTHFSTEQVAQILIGEKPNDLVSALFQKVMDNGLGKCIYVIVDEYDHFANNILSQGKEMFHDLVRTDGYVRPFYEALKKGTEQVIDRMFLTGVLPILLDSLTSGFNIGTNLSTDARFNEMFGFTEAEIDPILTALGDQVCHEEVRIYYNGYRFSPQATHSVYNSDMILYYGLRYEATDGQIDNMVDPNVVSDYRKIRAILSIGDQTVEEQVLAQIVEQEYVVVAEITPLFVLTQDTEVLFDEQTLLSLLFYMGYLSITAQRGFLIELRMPNLVLKSLYFEYMHYALMKRARLRINGIQKGEMLQELVDGKIDRLIALTEHLLHGLSNRDYERFDEKYIKVVMLSLLSDVNVYIPHSEYEVNGGGYVDIYLQAAFEPDRSASYFFELKYVKARASKAALDRTAQDGADAMERYLTSSSARAVRRLQGYVLVFRKDRCVRQIACPRPA